MRLITHNMLKCNIRGVVDGYPLVLEADSIQIDNDTENEFDKDKIILILKKVNWIALKASAASLSLSEELDLDISSIEEVKDELYDDIPFLQKVHKLLFDIHVIDGALICPESGRRFPIKDGIPNMLLHEDEV